MRAAPAEDDEPGAAQTAARRGRARRHDADEERTLILDAAMQVLRDNKFADAPIAEILDEAGLSTRAFYRRFKSKDDLLLALHLRDAELLARRLEERVAAAGSPADGLRAWITEVAKVRTDRRRSERANLLGSEVVRRSPGFEEQTVRALELAARPLRAVLEAGRADGSFPAADPRRDVALIQSMVWPFTARAPQRGSTGATLEHVVTFCLRALGASSA